MKISTNTSILTKHYTYERAIEMIANAGFDAFDLSLFELGEKNSIFSKSNYREVAQHIRKVADSFKIVCNQAHAPFPSSYEDNVLNQQAFATIVRAMEISSILGAEHIVVHGVKHRYYPEHKEELLAMNRAFYQALVPYCTKFGIKVAIENVYTHDPRRGVCIQSVFCNPTEFREFIEQFSDGYITGCVDVGHCGLSGYDAAYFIRQAGHSCVKAVHIHDNNHRLDQHLLPYQGKIDWEELTTAFAEIEYDGDMTLETDCFLEHLPKDLLFDGLCFMKKTAKHLADKIVEKGKI